MYLKSVDVNDKVVKIYHKTATYWGGLYKMILNFLIVKGGEYGNYIYAHT